jgi:hypothetical protein
MTDGFEDRLWRDLVRDHGGHLATLRRPGSTTRNKRPLLLGGAVSVAGAATVGALVLSATTSTPAYAVSSNSDGTITVTIHDIAGVAGANAQLARLGVRARAVPAVANCPTAVSRVPEYEWAGKAWRPAPASFAVTLTPSEIPSGETLVLAAREISHDHVELGVMMVHGQAPGCSDQADASVHPA